MKKWFPDMMDRPKPGVVFCIFVYWVFAFVVFPFLVPVIGHGLWYNTSVTAWLDLIYYVVNAVCLTLMCKEYLADSFFNVQTDTRNFLKTAAIALLLMLLVTPWNAVKFYTYGPQTTDYFPLSEMAIALLPGYFAYNLPVWGTLVLTFLTPFSISLLFYASTFAPAAETRPWLGYLLVCVVTALPNLFDIFWREDIAYNLTRYLLQLPIHLIACWSYQKTDTVWTPILALAGFNLAASLYAIFFGF